MIAGLLASSAVVLVVAHITHVEFLLHVAAIPIEVLVAVVIVERWLQKREAREKKRQLMYIKSWMFRGGMRPLFIANFRALQSPSLTFAQIRAAGIVELRQLRARADTVTYRSPQAAESVIREYVKAQPIWTSFLERAIAFNFEDVFHSMIGMLHFIEDVRLFQQAHPNGSYLEDAPCGDPGRSRAYRIIGDGIRLFLDYAIELKAEHPVIFDEVLRDYEESA